MSKYIFFEDKSLLLIVKQFRYAHVRSKVAWQHSPLHFKSPLTLSLECLLPFPILLYTCYILHFSFKIIFFLNCCCFGWTRGPFFCFYSSQAPLRGQPTVDYHPRWQSIQGLAVHCMLGRLLESNLGLQVYSLVSLPLSPTAPKWATTAPIKIT